jgi:ribokinase
MATVDYVSVVDFPLQPDQKIPIQRFSIQGGGPVATALVTLQRLGAQTAIATKIGDDSLGQYVESDLRREGVNTSGVVVQEGGETPFAFVLVDSQTGRRTIAYHASGVTPLRPDELPANFLAGAEFLHLDGHLPDAQVEAARQARERRIPVVYDAGGVHDRANELVTLADYLVTSERFPAEFTGSRKLPQAMSKLMEYGPKVVVTTLAERGCRLATREGQADVVANRVEGVVDTTGAGDVFHGAFIFGLLRQWDLRRACDFANTTAGLKCRALGGREGIPTLAEVERVMLYRGMM